MEFELIVISSFVTVLSIGLLSVALASYRKHRHLKLFFVSLMFLVFLIKGMILSLSIFYDDLSALIVDVYGGIFDLIILFLLFITTLKR